MPLITPPIKNIKEVTEPDAAINFILREFVMSKVSCDEMSNMDMIVELLRPQLEVTKEDIEPVIIMGLYHHRNLIGSPSSFIKADNDRLL